MSSEFKHNRKRNSGLVYELLVRQVTSQILEKDKKGCKKAVRLLKKYFSPGSPLAQERELFEIIRETRGVSRPLAQKVIGEVLRFSRQMDQKKIEKEKSNLIKEINYGLGQDFFGRHRISDYRLFASVYMLIDSARRGSVLNENVARMKLEEALINYMCSTPDRPSKKEDDSEIDAVVLAVATKKFQEKYGRALSPNQRVILEGYLNMLVAGGDDEFLGLMVEEKKRILKVLRESESMKEFREDPVMLKKLAEARDQLEQLDCSAVSDELVEEVMLHHRLIEEIKSNG